MSKKFARTPSSSYVLVKSASPEINELPQTLPRHDAMLSGNKLRIMIAESDIEKELGLMFVGHLPMNEGMLFRYAKPAKLSFWMKNTKIPLDLIFLDGDMRVIEIICNMKPGYGVPDDKLARYSSIAEASSALELAAGAVRKLSISVGDKLKIIGKKETAPSPGAAPE